MSNGVTTTPRCHMPIRTTVKWRKYGPYVWVTTLSGMYYASVTSIIHDRRCCNLLISWQLTRWR